MGVQNLSESNFSLSDGRMMCNVDGICLVMFKSNGCKFSSQFFPIFTKLSRDSRLTWASVNIDGNRRIIKMALNTKTPINSVPVIIMYVNGRPYAKFNGDRTSDKLSSFVDNILDKVGDTGGGSQSFITPGYTPTHPTPNASISHGITVESQTDNPNLPSGITKTPRNAPYLAYLR